MTEEPKDQGVQNGQEEGPGGQNAANAMAGLVVQRMREGADKETILHELDRQGFKRSEVEGFVSNLYDRLLEEAGRETITGGAVAGAVILGGIVAVVSAVAWIALIYFTGTEIGLVAWAIGGLVGLAVRFGSGRRRGKALQFIAAFWAFVGVGLGKGILYLLLSSAELEAGEDAFTAVFGFFDILWFILAVTTAWQMLRGSGLGIARPPGAGMGPGSPSQGMGPGSGDPGGISNEPLKPGRF